VEGVFLSNDGSWNGIRYQDAGTGHKLVYTSFPFEAVSESYKRDTLMARVLNWLGPVTPEYMPPAIPSGLALQQSYDTVHCTWLANTDGDIAGYNVYRSVQSGLPVWVKVGTVLHSDTVFADTTVDPGVTYNYALTSFDTCTAPANESLKSLWVRISVAPWKLGVEGEPVTAVPARFMLEQNRPNPFSGSTEIRFALPQPGRVELNVYNVAGQRVRTLSPGELRAGYHAVGWDGRDGQGNRLSNGVYFYRLEARGLDGRSQFAQTKRLTIVK
jgi:hypothetical protein